jgi:putative peptide zinc metalloprotease protein
MAADAPATDLERRKSVRIRLRADLIATVQQYEGSTYWVLKDPLSLRYYRFDEYDHFLLQMMDGTHTLDEAQQAFEERFRPRRLTLEDLEAFAQMLLKSGLAYHDLPQAGQQLYDRRRQRRRSEWLRRLTNILYIEFPLFDPDPLLTRLVAWFGWIFRPWFAVVSIAIMLAALLLVATHFETFWSMLPTSQEFFSFKNLAYLWLALGVVKILHEFGHGLTCKAMGGEVHDMGALLMCLTPCFYMNVTDAWTLPDKWRRIVVGLAGVYVELLVAALATFVWWNTPGEQVLHNLSASLMVVCSVNTLLFNGNPLLRFDGYYVLADWLEIPNLRERCNAFFKRMMMKHCLGMEVMPETPMALWRRLLFVIYALASYIYGWVITFSVLWSISGFLPPKLAIISKMMALAALASMIGWPLWNLGKGIYDRGKLPTMQPRRVSITVAVAICILLLFFLVPLPVSRIRQIALVQPRPEAAEKLFVTLPGTLERLHVRDGQHVEKGDILAEFRNLEHEGQLEETRTQHAIRVVQMRALRQQVAETSDLQERGRLEVAIAQADGERKVYLQQLAVQQKALERLVLRAPRSGIVMGAPRREEVGKSWDKDQTTPFCSIGDPTRLRALVPVRPHDYRLLKEDLGPNRDLAVTMRVHGWGGRTWQGKVAPLAESEAQEVPLALTTRGGGPLALKPGVRPGTFVPQIQHYLIAVDFQNAEADEIWPGSLGQVKIHCRWRTGAWWLWRTISTAFDIGLMG